MLNMVTRKGSAAITAVTAAALLSCVGLNAARAQATGQTYVGRVYTLHIKSFQGCPSLDWHIVVGENHTLSGMIAVDNMKTMYRVVGSYEPGKSFRLDGHQVDGNGTGAINGKIEPTGIMTATLGGLPVGSACQGRTVYVPWGNSPVLNYDTGGEG
jgi:hypothetical protein